MPPHTIRLRDPWQHQRAPAGGVRWSRSFRWPTELSERETVWLVISDRSAEVELNGQILSAGHRAQAGRYDISERLSARNRLVVEVPRASEIRDFDVVLEIAESA
jgi:hypothetical protein